MSSFTNSEQLYGVTQANCSGGYVNVVTGAQGVLFSVVSSLNSGAAVLPSLSGGVLAVYDSVSGNTNPTGSGLNVLYFFTHGSSSGTLTGGLPTPLAPDQWVPQPFLSGLNILISGAVGERLTITYRKGV